MRQQPIFGKPAMYANRVRMKRKGWIFEGETHF